MSGPLGPGGVLILEILDADRNSDIPGPLLPSLLAQLRAHGRPAAWRILGVPTPPYPADGSSPHVFELAREDREVVLDCLAELQPEQVLVSRHLEEGSLALLAEGLPHSNVSCLARLDSRSSLRETGAPAWLDTLLSDLPDDQPLHRGVVPAYDRQALNPLAREIRPYTHLYLGSECLYRKRIEDNRFFADLDLEDCVSRRGCTFCLPPFARGADVAEAPVARALELIEAA